MGVQKMFKKWKTKTTEEKVNFIWWLFKFFIYINIIQAALEIFKALLVLGYMTI